MTFYSSCPEPAKAFGLVSSFIDLTVGKWGGEGGMESIIKWQYLKSANRDSKGSG